MRKVFMKLKRCSQNINRGGRSHKSCIFAMASVEGGTFPCCLGKKLVLNEVCGGHALVSLHVFFVKGSF